MAVKGRTNNPNGRPKGSPNKSTEMARQAIAKFVDDNSERFQGWLDEIYEEHGARDAFNCVKDLIEYHVPKLSRTENRDIDKDGNDKEWIININKNVLDARDNDNE